MGSSEAIQTKRQSEFFPPQQEGVLEKMGRSWNVVVEGVQWSTHIVTFVFFRIFEVMSPQGAARLEIFWGYIRTSWFQIRLRFSQEEVKALQSELSKLRLAVKETEGLQVQNEKLLQEIASLKLTVSTLVIEKSEFIQQLKPASVSVLGHERSELGSAILKETLEALNKQEIGA